MLAKKASEHLPDELPGLPAEQAKAIKGQLEWLRGFGSAAKVEPRVSFVWESKDGLTGHIGYARYASAPRIGEQSNGAKLSDEPSRPVPDTASGG